MNRLNQKATDTSLYQIFERINTGGRSLTPQEIRNCIYQGKFNDLLKKLNENIYWRKLYLEDSLDDRMKDIEFVLRFFALSNKNLLKKEITQISLKKELNLYMKKMNEEDISSKEEEFNKTFKFIYENLNNEAFRNFVKNKDGTFKDFETLSEKFHPTIFDAISIATLYALRSNPNIEIKDLKERRVNLLKNKDFINYTNIRTTNLENIIGRIKLALKELFGIEYE